MFRDGGNPLKSQQSFDVPELIAFDQRNKGDIQPDSNQPFRRHPPQKRTIYFFNPLLFEPDTKQHGGTEKQIGFPVEKELTEERVIELDAKIALSAGSDTANQIVGNHVLIPRLYP